MKSLLSNNEPPFAIGLWLGSKGDVYVPIMTYALPNPLDLMELSVCGCKTSFNTMRCKWIKNQLMSTDLHKCVSCKNDDTEYNVTVHDDSSEVQLLLLCLLIIL